jgi:mannose-6-phosphate isomerase-like protein (cupin superfamily)
MTIAHDDGPAPDPEQMLVEMSRAYQAKLPPDCDLRVNIEVNTPPAAGASPAGFQWHVISSGGELTYGPGLVEGADTTLTLTADTLRRLYRGEWSGLGAAGRASIRDAAPLDFTIPPGVHPLAAMRRGYYFVTHFFSVDVPTRVPFGEGHTRKIHGGHAAPLFYGEGLRSAYYRLEPGDVLNDDGARDPMHQGFIIIGGCGIATIGELRFNIRQGQAVYIPPHTVHMLTPGGPTAVELIWLAWGEKA